MNALKPGGTREQEAIGALLDRAAIIRVQVGASAEQVPEVLPYFDRLTDAVASFGLCELHARSLDRSLALDVFEERRSGLERDIARTNEAGIASIGRAREALLPLREALGRLNLDERRVNRRLEEAQREFRLTVADWEMKGSDAGKVVERLDEIVTVVRSSGLGAMTDHLDRTLQELIEVRQRPDRGAIDNIPWWKIMFIVGAFGWWIAGVVSGATGGHPNATLTLALIGLLHLVAFVLFC